MNLRPFKPYWVYSDRVNVSNVDDLELNPYGLYPG